MPNDDPLRALAHACLDDLDEIVEAFAGEMHTLEPYAAGLVPWHELREDADASFELLLRLTAGLPVPQRLDDVGERIGRRRAELGVPLEVLLRAVRTDFRVLWEALLRRVAPDELPTLVHSTVRVWDAVEQHAARIQLAYLQESAVLAREREHERSHLVARLLASDGRDGQLVSQVATALEVRPTALFAVAAAPTPADRALRQAAERLRSQRVALHIQNVEHRAVLIAQLPEGCGAVPIDWLPGVPCGLGPVALGLSAVPRAVRTAIEVADTLRPADGGPRTVVESWPHIVATRLADLAQALCAAVLPGEHALTDHERSRLLETVVVYLRCGSASATAEEVFCHRNTVLNRLNRFAELTGLELTRPDHAAAVIVALACHERAASAAA
ncbi:MAG TPA: helix-turn-helix domain-containing protein [Jatrophihabitans sp.]|nr:helix-turn-helix domain-containing protein [Jatrophihabitans sp.]